MESKQSAFLSKKEVDSRCHNTAIASRCHILNDVEAKSHKYRLLMWLQLRRETMMMMMMVHTLCKEGYSEKSRVSYGTCINYIRRVGLSAHHCLSTYS